MDEIFELLLATERQAMEMRYRFRMAPDTIFSAQLPPDMYLQIPPEVRQWWLESRHIYLSPRDPWDDGTKEVD